MSSSVDVLSFRILVICDRAGVVGTGGSGVVVGSWMSIIMKRMLSGSLFLFVWGLSDMYLSSDEFNSFRHDVSDTTAVIPCALQYQS
ncbi:unnamed protein product [Lactuca virosa]|uniref:Uncharacterized protein n=1 Tax=Lactuca virosa TaxID=75947 RepID=A0AAU9PRR6_9ASTR|nr:unnamed protein product [Lactuca virosa]